MKDVFENWDDFGQGNFLSFATGELVSRCGFERRKAEILSDLLSSFVDEADEWQKMCLESPDPQVKARTELEKLLNGQPLNPFSDFFRKFIFGNTSEYVRKLRRFLPEQEAEEAQQLFFSKGGDGDESPMAASAIDMAVSETILEHGVIAEELVKLLECLTDASSDAGAKNIPTCVSRGLVTDLLSSEEALLKKLCALDRLLRGVTRDPEAKGAAPILAIEAARLAFKEVEEAKSKLRGSRLLALRAIVEKDDSLGGKEA